MGPGAGPQYDVLRTKLLARQGLPREEWTLAIFDGTPRYRRSAGEHAKRTRGKR